MYITYWVVRIAAVLSFSSRLNLTILHVQMKATSSLGYPDRTLPVHPSDSLLCSPRVNADALCINKLFRTSCRKADAVIWWVMGVLVTLLPSKCHVAIRLYTYELRTDQSLLASFNEKMVRLWMDPVEGDPPHILSRNGAGSRHPLLTDHEKVHPKHI